MLLDQNLVVNVQQIHAHASENPLTEQDKILTVIPLFHVYGMTCAMNFGFFLGSSLILLPRFESLEVLKTIQKHRPAYFPGVPTMYVALNAYPGAEKYGVDAIRIINSGSASLPVELIQSFEKKTGAVMYEGYGLSEASPTTHSNPRSGQRKPGSVGIPLPGTGAWTGSGVAALLHMDKKKAFLAILLGVAIATVIMSIISYGLLGALFG